MGSSPQDRGADGLAAAIPAPRPPRALDVDRDALEAAVRDMLRALGEDVHREGLADTPKRVAKAMAFAVRGYGMSATHHVESALFHEPGLKSDEEALAEALADDEPPALCAPIPADPSALARPSTVLIRDVPFFSTNEDNLLPFYGRCHIGYVPRDGVIVGLSKVARVAEVFARRAQTPDRLAADIADAIARGAAREGVRVFLEGAQMGPHEPAPVRGEADVGCFQSTHPEGAQYRAEFAAMLAEEVGAGIGPGVGLGGGGGSAVAERRRARGVSRPSPEGRYPSPNIVDDVEVGSVTTTTRLSIGDGEGDGDRVGGGASREGAGGGSTDRGSGSDGGSDASDDAATDDAKMCPGVSRGNADAPVEGTRGVVVRAARLDDSGSRPATPALPEASAARGDASGVPGSAPPAAAEAAERMMRALGLDARMSSENSRRPLGDTQISWRRRARDTSWRRATRRRARGFRGWTPPRLREWTPPRRGTNAKDARRIAPTQKTRRTDRSRWSSSVTSNSRRCANTTSCPFTGRCTSPTFAPRRGARGPRRGRVWRARRCSASSPSTVGGFRCRSA